VTMEWTFTGEVIEWRGPALPGAGQGCGAASGGDREARSSRSLCVSTPRAGNDERMGWWLTGVVKQALPDCAVGLPLFDRGLVTGADRRPADAVCGW
jgi:hypothetical protein